LLIKFPLLNEVAIDGNGLHLLLEGWQCLDLLFYLLLDVDLRLSKVYLFISAAVLRAVLRTLLDLILSVLIFPSHQQSKLI
jgi:hypothetical protein